MSSTANPYSPPQSPVQPPAEPVTPASAIVALVLACVPLLLIHLVGAGIGIFALVKINGNPQAYKGKGLAIAAIVIGFAWLVLVGLFAAVAVPNFLKFQSRAKQSEAKVTLKAIYTAETAYFAEHGTYAPTFEAIGFRPEEGNRYSYYLGDAAISGSAGPKERPAAAAVSQKAFKAVAVGNLDADATLDVWTIDQDGDLQNSANDVEQ
jgi:type II secretory pathway pseudopilin PulG